MKVHAFATNRHMQVSIVYQTKFQCNCSFDYLETVTTRKVDVKRGQAPRNLPGLKTGSLWASETGSWVAERYVACEALLDDVEVKDGGAFS